MSTKHILIVDLNRFAQGYVRDLLVYFGYSVDCVSNWDEARMAVSRTHYNLVMFDEGLVHRGLGTPIRALREEGFDQPVLIMSDMALSELWMNCMELGAVDLISKPVSPSTLKFMVESILKKQSRTTPVQVINLVSTGYGAAPAAAAASAVA